MSARPRQPLETGAGWLAHLDAVFLGVAAVLAGVHLFVLMSAVVDVRTWTSGKRWSPARSIAPSTSTGSSASTTSTASSPRTFRRGSSSASERGRSRRRSRCNFGIYLCIWIALWRFAKEQLGKSLHFVPALALCTLPAENHYSGFQGQFHFFLLFFVLALWLGTRSARWGWLGALCAIAGAYSFSAGVICAGVCALFYGWLAWARRKEARQYVVQAIAIGASLAAWTIGFEKNPGHPPFALPWTWRFWEHLLNEIGVGLGFTRLSVIPGIVIAMRWGACSRWRSGRSRAAQRVARGGRRSSR